MISLKEVSAQLKDFFERTEQDAKSFLEMHAPGLADAAEKLDSDPLVQAALGAVLPDEVRTALAEVINKAAAAIESHVPAPAEPAPAETPDPATPAA